MTKQRWNVTEPIIRQVNAAITSIRIPIPSRFIELESMVLAAKLEQFFNGVRKFKFKSPGQVGSGFFAWDVR
jgi:hypothetical protein